MVKIWIRDGKNSDPRLTSRIRNTAKKAMVRRVPGFQFKITACAVQPPVGAGLES